MCALPINVCPHFLSQGRVAGLLLVIKPGAASVLVVLTEASGNLELPTQLSGLLSTKACWLCTQQECHCVSDFCIFAPICEHCSHDLGLTFLTFKMEISSISFVELREERKACFRKVHGSFASVSIQKVVNAHPMVHVLFSSNLEMSQWWFYLYLIFLIDMCFPKVEERGGICIEVLGLIQAVREDWKHFLCRQGHSIRFSAFTNGPQPKVWGTQQ